MHNIPETEGAFAGGQEAGCAPRVSMLEITNVAVPFGVRLCLRPRCTCALTRPRDPPLETLEEENNV